MHSNSTQLYLSAEEVADRVGRSRFEIYRGVKAGTFPAPDALVGHTYGWKPETVVALVLQQRGVPSSAAEG